MRKGNLGRLFISNKKIQIKKAQKSPKKFRKKASNNTQTPQISPHTHHASPRLASPRLMESKRLRLRDVLEPSPRTPHA